jgi:hypothetical protein
MLQVIRAGAGITVLTGRLSLSGGLTMTRVISAALSVTRAGFDSSHVVKAIEIGLTLIATTAILLLISFVAVAMGIS